MSENSNQAGWEIRSLDWAKDEIKRLRAIVKAYEEGGKISAYLTDRSVKDQAEQNGELIRLRAINAELAAVLGECAEYIDQVSAIDPDDDPCAWPIVDGTAWCSALCKEHGCAKARTNAARKSIAKAKGE